MTSTQSTEPTARIDLYLPAVVQPTTEPGLLERLLTAPFRRDRAARTRTE